MASEAAVDALLDDISGSWAHDDDPKVLALPGDRRPVVADVDGDLRVLQSGLVYARRVTVDQIRRWLADYDDPARVERLSAFAARFDRSCFEDLPPDPDDDGGDDGERSGGGRE